MSEMDRKIYGPESAILCSEKIGRGRWCSDIVCTECHRYFSSKKSLEIHKKTAQYCRVMMTGGGQEMDVRHRKAKSEDAIKSDPDIFRYLEKDIRSFSYHDEKEMTKRK